MFSDAAQRDGERLQDELNAAIERHRTTLLEALHLLEQKLPALAEQRNEALAAVMDRSLPASLKGAVVERAEQLVADYQTALAQQQQLRTAPDTLAAKARSILAVLTDPNLDPPRWREPAVFAAFRRALSLLVKHAVVSEGTTSGSYFVQLTVTTDPIAEPDSGSAAGAIERCFSAMLPHSRSCGTITMLGFVSHRQLLLQADRARRAPA